jgi:hypothetical protein
MGFAQITAECDYPAISVNPAAPTLTVPQLLLFLGEPTLNKYYSP